MRGTYLDVALLVLLEHFIRVAVIGGNEHCYAVLVAYLLQSRETDINAFNADYRSLHRARVTDHIAIREVTAQEVVLLGLDSLDKVVDDIRRLHPRAPVKAYLVGRDLLERLQLLGKLTAAIAVPEIGNMTVLLSFRYRILVQTRCHKHLGERVVDFWRINEEARGELQVTIILQHTRVANVGLFAAVEVVELVKIERHRQLNSAVAAEVVQYYAVAVNDLADGNSVLRDNEAGKVLIVSLAELGAVCLNSLGRGRERSALALNVNIPAALHHCPIGLVTIHCDSHTSAAARDLAVERTVVQLLEYILKLLNIYQRGIGRNIAPVQQNVNARLFNSLRLSLFQHVEQVRNIRVNVAVGKQADKMQRAVLCLNVRDYLFPRGRIVHLAALDILVYELSALRVYLSATERVMSDLGVAHVVIAGQTHSVAVRLKTRVGAVGEKPVKRWRIRLGNSVAKSRLGIADAIHYYQ